MKRYIKSNKIMAGAMYPEDLYDREFLAEKLEDKFYDWTSVKFTIDPDSIKLFTVRNWVSSAPWFRLTAVYDDLSDEMIERYFDDSTPFLNLLLNDDNIKFNPYSDIEVEDSDDIKRWYDGLTLDYVEIDNEYENQGYYGLESEEELVGQKIIDILYSHKDEISDIIIDFIYYDDDDWEEEDY